MSFGDAIRTGFRKYAEFGGRASRREFWWWMLFTALAGAALNAVWLLLPFAGFIILIVMCAQPTAGDSDRGEAQIQESRNIQPPPQRRALSDERRS